MKRFRHFWSEEAGATAIEYGLIATLIVVAIIGGLNLFASNAVTMFGHINTAISSVMR